MGKTLLQQLYDGEVYPAEKINPQCKEYKQINRAISDEKQYFRDTLTEEARKRFEKLDDLRFQSESVYSYEHYLYGFRLGVGLMIEALTNTGSQYEE